MHRRLGQRAAGAAVLQQVGGQAVEGSAAELLRLGDPLLAAPREEHLIQRERVRARDGVRSEGPRDS